MNLAGDADARVGVVTGPPGNSGKLGGLYMNDTPRRRDWEGVDQQAEALLEHRLGQGGALEQEADSAVRRAPRLASSEAALGLGGELIARVLRRAHQAAAAMGRPDEVRGVLHAAHCFADELAAASPRFDRQSFIVAVTEGSS